jgi:hypothetical protein
MIDDDLPAVPDHVVSTSFDSSDGVLIDLNAKRYYKLNETGMLIWTALEEGTDRSAVIDRIVARYDVTPEKAAASLARFLQELSALEVLASAE